MANPSASAKRAPIGTAYRPSRFETRSSDGSYRALMPTQGRQCEQVQSGVLGTRRRLSWLGWATYATAVAALAAFAFVTFWRPQ